MRKRTISKCPGLPLSRSPTLALAAVFTLPSWSVSVCRWPERYVEATNTTQAATITPMSTGRFRAVHRLKTTSALTAKMMANGVS